MTFMFAMGTCVLCRQVCTFNPELVPSVRVRFVDGEPVADPNGSREPICERCVPNVNQVRAEKGLPPIVPLPGAYDIAEVT